MIILFAKCNAPFFRDYVGKTVFEIPCWLLGRLISRLAPFQFYFIKALSLPFFFSRHVSRL